MNPIAEAFLQSWSLDPWPVMVLVLLAAFYAVGWHRLHRSLPQKFGWGRLLSFLGGLASLLIALESPLDAFANLSLTVHMIQHLFLMMVAPPLILFGAPYLPLLRGLPRGWLKYGVGPFLASPGLQKVGRVLTHPLFCLLAFVASSLIWHVPFFFELALGSSFWHGVEHFCFVATALLFWWPVFQPWPSRPQWPRWALIPYLLFADLANTALAAFLTFCERVVYPSYAAAPHLANITALGDQAAAGVIMWVPGSVAFLVPAALLTIAVLTPERCEPYPVSARVPHARRSGSRFRHAQGKRTLDLLRVPALGPALRSLRFRRLLQMSTLLVAFLIVLDGFRGNQMAPMNLAGVLPWTYFRGFAVIALLLAGNFFCMACPFTLVRDWGRYLFPTRLKWPRSLRSKWLSVGLLVTYLYSYEAFGLWNSPLMTAWIIVGYFVAALVIDGIFQGASFCKYVCPIGQYNFVNSLVSPLEVRRHDATVCQSCGTYECIRGGKQGRGCELELFMPKKHGNLDCTFCLDCVRACPHENIGLMPAIPGRQLLQDGVRSSIGILSDRFDFAVLALVLVFGAFVNAAAMITPVASWEEATRNILGLKSLFSSVLLFFVAGLVLAPGLLALSCAVLSRMLGKFKQSSRQLASSFVFTLIPLGFSMWLAHMAYHLVTGGETLFPLFQEQAVRLGTGRLGQPGWQAASNPLGLNWLPSFQVLLLDGGLLLSLYLAWRTALRFLPFGRRAAGLVLPWACLAVVLYLSGVWILMQPMQMRGMMPGA